MYYFLLNKLLFHQRQCIFNSLTDQWLIDLLAGKTKRHFLTGMITKKAGGRVVPRRIPNGLLRGSEHVSFERSGMFHSAMTDSPDVNYGWPRGDGKHSGNCGVFRFFLLPIFLILTCCKGKSFQKNHCPWISRPFACAVSMESDSGHPQYQDAHQLWSW